MSWVPTPKTLNPRKLTADLLACHQLIVGGNSNFTNEILELFQRCLFQTAILYQTNFEGILKQTTLKANTLLSTNDLLKYLTSQIAFQCNIVILGSLSLTATTSPTLAVNNTVSTDSQTLFQALQSGLTGTNVYSYIILGQNTSTSNDALQIRFVQGTSNYGAFLLTNSSAGFRVLQTNTNFVSELRVKDVRLNPIITSTYTTLTNAANPSPGISWTSAVGINRVDVTFVGITQATGRGTVFLQCGQGGSYLTTAGQYSGVTTGNYAYNLNPPTEVLSTTNLGIAIFNDYLEVGGSLNGTVSFYRMGTPTGLGELWAFQIQVYAKTNTTIPNTYANGFGYVQFPSTTPSFTSVRFNSFAGNWGSGSWSVQYV